MYRLYILSCKFWNSEMYIILPYNLNLYTNIIDILFVEQQLRKCQVCKKLIKSRLLLLRHLKMHSDAQSNTNPETLRRKLRTRQGTRKIVPLRKRGRPRKL